MNKTVRNTLLIVLAIALLCFGGLLGINYFLKQKVETFVNNNLPEHYNITYSDLSVHLLTGTITYSGLQLKIKNQDNDDMHTSVHMDSLIIEDISYQRYLFSNEILIEDIKLKSPVIRHYKHLYLRKQDSSSQKGMIKLGKPLTVEELSIDNSTIHIFDKTKDSVFLYAENLTVEIDDIHIDPETLRKRLPLKYGDYDAKADSIALKVGSRELLKIADFDVHDRKLVARQLQLKTVMSKQQLDASINRERDHIDVEVDSISIDSLDFGFKTRKLFTRASQVSIDGLDATIYRNKLLPDDQRTKKAYGQLLRELPFSMDVDSVTIRNTALEYQEKTKAENPPGTLTFEKMNATIYNFGNTYTGDTKTRVLADAVFMGYTPMNVDWSFAVQDASNQFLFKGDMEQLQAKQLNSFTRPNLNVGLVGEMDKVYFTISGTDTGSNIDMRIDYEDFKVELLKDNGRKERKFISGLLNIFVAKDSKDDGKNFSDCKATVTPDRTKSFFNYVWKNLEAALKDCLM